MHDPKLCLTDPHCAVQHGVEHRRQLAGRTADDLEHVGGRRLLLKQFAQLVEQPRVLDGDDGLGSEILHQFDLLFGEGPNFLAIK